MSVTTRKVDDRSRVVLPEAFTGRLVTVESIGSEEVRIRILRPARRRPLLSELLARVTDENQHEFISFGQSQGNEAL